MSDYEKLNLYDHNIKSYEQIKKQLAGDKVAAIIHATGTGKSFNALQLALDNKYKKITYIVPFVSIIEHLKEVIDNCGLSLENDFPNLNFITYRSLVGLSEEEIKDLDIDLLILDEFHHIGAPVWGQRVNSIVESHPDMQILGMTAYTVRDRGTSYERDMTNPDTDELFSNKVVSNYDLCDAMIDGVLPKPIYKSAYINLEKTCDAIESKIELLNHNSKDYQELSKLLKDIRKRIHEAPSISDIFKTNVKSNGKYIYFCPVFSEKGKNDIDTIVTEAKTWIQEMGLTTDDYEFYITTSEMGEEGKKNRQLFYNNQDINGNDTSKKLRIMFAINQYNEGVHAPGLDGVIMGRTTGSDIIYFEQLGRALSVRGKTKEEYEKLYSKSLSELIALCKKREIRIIDDTSKEEIIEKLLAPTIIDLANNIDFIKNLENNLTDRVKEIEDSKQQNSRIIHLGNTSFDISMLNEDLFEILRYMSDRLTMTWMDKYNLAKAYYEHHGNLDISVSFKTSNGYEYDENGVALGHWIYNQRSAYLGQAGYKISPERVDLLKRIGMRFEANKLEIEWNKNYELAKIYYEHHGNLEIPERFKTINGYEYDENGIRLGTWISNQRNSYLGRGNYKISPERVDLLKRIGMRFETNKLEIEWNKNYELAKAYYEHHGDLEVPFHFKTINGYEYEENGIRLGNWIDTQRSAYLANKLALERVDLLKRIGMRFEANKLEIEWNKNYELAKAYYEHYGNLEIPGRFKTINGYEYDENGIKLGLWIQTQRSAYLGRYEISPERVDLLKRIGMRFEFNKFEIEWNKKYELAKAYYEHYGNLEIPGKFKTINGYEYDENGISLGEWLSAQRAAYLGKAGYKISPERVDLLKRIGMRFEANKLEIEWNKNYELAKIYYEHHGDLEIPYSFKTINGIDYDENGVTLGNWIATQRAAYLGRADYKIAPERIKLLKSIGMRFEANKSEIEWNKKYNLAKIYYEHYGNLKIHPKFKTINGIDYDENGVKLRNWIDIQKKAYFGQENYKMAPEQIKLLESIGMVWLSENVDIKKQEQEITEENKSVKQKEIQNRFYSLLNQYDGETLPSAEELNQEFINQLNRSKK